MPTTEQLLQTALIAVATNGDLACALEEAKAEDLTVTRARSFEDEGVLTDDAGLLLRTGDGVEFQITILRYR